MSEFVNLSDIPMISVESSNISEIGYDNDSETLVVEFNHGGKYAYDGVPAEEFDALKVAESKGKYFIANIKGKYTFRKV
jgi:hypothetical protein